jgi:bacterioferritin (cytochrome b1)
MTSIPNPGFNSDYSADRAIDNDKVCDQLNSLLRGEISAAETYKMAIDKISDSDSSRDADGRCLRDMQEDHGRAAQWIRSRIRELGGEPADSSGAWGGFAQTIQGTANIFGDTAAMKSLKEGEEHGLKDYQDALDHVDMTSASMFESEFIPNQQEHIMTLDSVMNSGNRA